MFSDVWLRRMLTKLGVKQASPTTLFVDNQESVCWIKNPVNHKRAKHVNVQYHFVPRMFIDGVIKVSYIHTTKQMADLLTKALTPEKFKNILSLLDN